MWYKWLPWPRVNRADKISFVSVTEPKVVTVNHSKPPPIILSRLPLASSSLSLSLSFSIYLSFCSYPSRWAQAEWRSGKQGCRTLPPLLQRFTRAAYHRAGKQTHFLARCVWAALGKLVAGWAR